MSKPTNKTYTFFTVKDIVEQLEVDQIDNFLIDFGVWLKTIKTGKSGNKNFDKIYKDLQSLLKILGKATGEPVKPFLKNDRFGWVDDGLHAPKSIRLGHIDNKGDFKEVVKITIPNKSNKQ